LDSNSKSADRIEQFSHEMSALANAMRPQGLGPVATSPYFERIISQTISGMTPQEIMAQLPQINVDPQQNLVNPYEIAAYVQRYVPMELRLAYRQIEKFRDSRGPFNPLEMLGDLLAVQHYRIGESLGRDINGSKSEDIRKEIDLGRSLCRDMVKIAQELGQLPYALSSAPAQDGLPAPRLVLRSEKSTEKPNGTKITEEKTAILSDICPEDAAQILSMMGEEIAPASPPAAPPSHEEDGDEG